MRDFKARRKTHGNVPMGLDESIAVVTEKRRRRSQGARIEYVEQNIIDYEILATLLRSPEQHPRAAAEDIASKTGFPVRYPFDTVMRRLKRWELGYPEKRRLWAERIRRSARLFVEYLRAAPEEVHQARERLGRALTDERNERFRINFAAIMVAILESGLEAPWLSPFKEVARTLNPLDFRFVLWELVDAVALSKGLAIKRSVQEEMQDMRSFLQDSLSRSQDKRRGLEDDGEASGTHCATQSDETMEQLEQDLEDFRTALEFTRTQIELLEAGMEEMREEASNEAVVVFFQEMNSERAGRLLDQFAISDKGLKKLRRSGYDFPPEAESIPASVRMFVRFLGERDVKPMAELGERLAITLEDSDEYDYQGSDFADGEDEKLVEIVRPGWEYKGTVISKPSVREVLA